MVAFRLGGDPGPQDFVCFFACLPLCRYQSDSNGSILCDHAKHVILLVKVKIVSNSSRNLK